MHAQARLLLGAAAALAVVGCTTTGAAAPSYVDPHPPATAAAIAAAVADPTRLEAQVGRDEARRPADVLAFSQIGPGDAVLDLEAGAGYYTRMLSNLVGPEGRVHAVSSTFVAETYPQAVEAIAAFAADAGNVTTQTAAFDALEFDQTYDAAVMVLFYHDTAWIPYDRAVMNQQIFDALEPGGTFLVIDHHAPEGSGVDNANTTHRIESSVVMEEILAAGFEFEAESDALAHPEDDRMANVFDESIRGQTDRFIYRFRRPVE